MYTFVKLLWTKVNVSTLYGLELQLCLFKCINLLIRKEVIDISYVSSRAAMSFCLLAEHVVTLLMMIHRDREYLYRNKPVNVYILVFWFIIYSHKLYLIYFFVICLSFHVDLLMGRCWMHLCRSNPENVYLFIIIVAAEEKFATQCSKTIPGSAVIYCFTYQQLQCVISQMHASLHKTLH